MTEYHYGEDFYKIYFPVPETIESGIIETTVRNGLSLDWTTRRDGGTDACYYYGTITDDQGTKCQRRRRYVTRPKSLRVTHDLRYGDRFHLSCY